MPIPRLDQGGIIVLAANVPPIRADQAGMVALASTAPPVRFDQGGLVALVAITPNVPVDQAGIIALAYGSPCGTRNAQIWTIRRIDGEVFRFTSLDRDLEYPPGSGVVYGACNSLAPSASENVAALDDAGSMDLSGALGGGDASAISTWDLFSGKFDGARVEAWLVSWDGPGRVRKLLGGTFAPVALSEAGFRTEIVGDGDKLKQTPLTQPVRPDCRWTFGDPLTCGKDLAPLTVTGTVDSGDGVRDFADAARTEPAKYFKFGRVTFTTGANAGITAEIKEHETGGAFTLWPRVPFAIAAGDGYAMTPGCTNLKGSDGGCKGCTAWGQLARYGGFDKVPGRDKRGKAANVRTS